MEGLSFNFCNLNFKTSTFFLLLIAVWSAILSPFSFNIHQTLKARFHCNGIYLKIQNGKIPVLSLISFLRQSLVSWTDLCTDFLLLIGVPVVPLVLLSRCLHFKWSILYLFLRYYLPLRFLFPILHLLGIIFILGWIQLAFPLVKLFLCWTAPGWAHALIQHFYGCS